MKGKKVVILHNQVKDDSPKDELDVLVQAGEVLKALLKLGYQPKTVPFTLDLERNMRAIKKIDPLFVFNLVESVEGNGQLIHLAPALLDHLGIQYTGCSQEAIFVTSNKILGKKLLQLAGVASPPWLGTENPVQASQLEAGTYLLKSVWEHASNWFDENSVIKVRDALELRTILEKKNQNSRGQFFAESYIEGREFNLAILAGTFLPVAEIHFVDYPAEKLKIVDFKAKWDEDSFEYIHTPRSFDFAEADLPLLAKLRTIARRCWEFFNLHGYARVDFRVDGQGRPWVLEINANPCLSPDSGFHAAAARINLTFTDLVEKIIADCLGR